MSKHEAKAALDACDLSNRESFTPAVQRDLENIYKEEPVLKRGKRAEIVIDEAAHEVVEQ
jgi:hypothetical protein